MAANYEKLELLGSGSYGKAWLVKCPVKSRQAVLKEIRLDCLGDKEIAQALVEVKVLGRCRHVNIVSYCEAFVNSGCLHIVMEYADSGDMQKKILEQKGIHFDTDVILDWFIQICFALKYLHSEHILHRDLKPQNLFMTSDGIVKMGDFGIARILQDTADHALTAIGTPYYLSPEVCQRKPYNSKSDMWSAGCVLYELCCLKVPFQAPNLPLLVMEILHHSFDPLPSHCGAVLEDLVAVLLKTDPSQRPTAEQVLSVPALQPRVKATFQKCVSHKQHRHRWRAASKECAFQSVSNEEKTKQATPCQQTYSVKSPLLRRLSVATPKLKAAIKRQRSVRSAEAVSTIQKQRKISKPPVLNLQEAILGIQPSSQHSESSNSPCLQTDKSSNTALNKEDEDVDNDDDVFYKDAECGKEQESQGRPCRANTAPETQEVTTDQNAVFQPWMSNKQVGEECAVGKSNNRLDHCGSELHPPVGKENQSDRIDSQTSPDHWQSETYTLVKNTGCEGFKSACKGCGSGRDTQTCLYHILYSATALSYSDKPSACRCLSRFLIAHLGSDLATHLCSLVHSALCAKDDYSVLERILDEGCRLYLPIVLKLLSWSDYEYLGK